MRTSDCEVRAHRVQVRAPGDLGGVVIAGAITNGTLSVVRAGDLDEALAIGRGCTYGNGASIFTRSGLMLTMVATFCCGEMYSPTSAGRSETYPDIGAGTVV